MQFLEDERYPALLRRAKERGAVAEIFLRHTRRCRIVVHQSSLESRSRSEQLGMALRAEVGGRIGLSSTTDLSDEGLEACLQAALSLAALADPLPAASIPEDASRDAVLADLGGAEILALDLEARESAALAAERAAFAFDARIAKSESASWEDRVDTSRVLNSWGLDRRQRRSRAALGVDLVAQQRGEERTALHFEERTRPQELDPQAIGELAASKALALLGSRVLPTEKAPVLLDHEVVAEFLDLLSPSFSARSVLLGTSLLAGRKGRTIAAREVELVDDPSPALGVGAWAFDDEGMAAQRTVLVSEGVFRSHLHNAHTARRMGEDGTSNALRSSFDSELGIGCSNLVLRPGTRTREAIVGDLSRGFYVQAVMGLHMADPVSGDFSLGIVGRRIEGGELADPVEGMTIAGNLLALLQAVEEIAADQHPHGDRGCASLLVGGLTVSGR